MDFPALDVDGLVCGSAERRGFDPSSADGVRDLDFLGDLSRS